MNEYGTRLIFVCTLFLLGYGVFFKALLIFLFNFTQSNNSLFSVWHQLGPFLITGSHPSGLTNGISVVRTIYSTCQLSNVGVGMRAVYIYNILILILLCSWISSTGILPVVSGFISYI